jgi:hypothetical protein
MISSIHQYAFTGGPSTVEACSDNGYRHGQDDPFDIGNREE